MIKCTLEPFSTLIININYPKYNPRYTYHWTTQYSITGDDEPEVEPSSCVTRLSADGKLTTTKNTAKARSWNEYLTNRLFKKFQTLIYMASVQSETRFTVWYANYAMPLLSHKHSYSIWVRLFAYSKTGKNCIFCKWSQISSNLKIMQFHEKEETC